LENKNRKIKMMEKVRVDKMVRRFLKNRSGIKLICIQVNELGEINSICGRGKSNRATVTEIKWYKLITVLGFQIKGS